MFLPEVSINISQSVIAMINNDAFSRNLTNTTFLSEMITDKLSKGRVGVQFGHNIPVYISLLVHS